MKNNFFYPSTPSKRKGRNGEKKWKIMTFIVATTSLPVNRPNETARTTITGTPHACAKKNDENSGHYINASSRPPERRPLERRTLAPKLRLRSRLCITYRLTDGASSKIDIEEDSQIEADSQIYAFLQIWST